VCIVDCFECICIYNYFENWISDYCIGFKVYNFDVVFDGDFDLVV